MDYIVTKEEVNRVAFLKGVDPTGKPLWEVIRLIQKAEGFEPCYGTKMFRCNNTNCLWRKNCQGLVNLIEVL